ncbi:MAG: DinB family protein [Ginsengibacter sp.]
MITETIHTTELFTSLDGTWNELTALISSTNAISINAVPYKDSWTPAQLATHVTKSNKAIAQGMEMEGKPAERDPEQGKPQIKKMFLDFEAKYKSPEFIVPEKKKYDKDEVVNVLNSSIDKLKTLRGKVNLIEIIALPIFGEVTKLELLYFVLYHTQRHIHQLKKMLTALK